MASADQLSQALVVGASKYQHLSSLRPTQDVPGVRDVLASPEYCGYPLEQVQVLEEDAATRDNILKALDAMCERSKAAAAGSRTFFYFSGHGGTGRDGSSYILPVDARKGEYATTALSARDLSRYLERCAGELTVVLDCCRAAGVASPGATPDPAAPAAPTAPAGEDDIGLAEFTDSFRNEVQARGRVVFAASRADGKSFVAQNAPYGLFTGHMLDGLRGAASTDGGDVTVHQLFDYVSQRVVLSSNKTQRPSFIASIEELYRLTRYPRPVQPAQVFEKDVYLSYDQDDPVQEDWVAKVFRPELERAGLLLWDYDDLGNMKLDIEEAIVKSKYVIVLLTASYLKDRFEDLKTTMAVIQAVNTRSKRFIAIQRELFNMPLYIQAFWGIEMTPQREMKFRSEMSRLIKRLKKLPHEH
jgi:hypothetical protein